MGLPRLSIVAAARPNFMKISPLIEALDRRAEIEVVHTGQHYDRTMSDAFFRDLRLPDPDVNLGVGSGSHSEQTAGVMLAYERHLLRSSPDAIIVVGDVNSTLAAALVGAKMGIPVAHVEAGLRSHDWSMPEEVNRVVVDRLSTWLFTPDAEADSNLVAEGIERGRIHRVGNIMIDTLLRNLPEARAGFPRVKEQLGLPPRYAVLTLHRPANVDSTSSLERIVAAVSQLSKDLEVFFSVHPRTQQRLGETQLDHGGRIRYLTPLGYLDFLALMDSSSLVLTDSGGIQEETSVLGIPCLTLRENTERPITCTVGTNRIVGTGKEEIVSAAYEALSRTYRPAEIPLWDGQTADRIALILAADH